MFWRSLSQRCSANQTQFTENTQMFNAKQTKASSVTRKKSRQRRESHWMSSHRFGALVDETRNHKSIMITRRNWLLKCSILVNIAVLLYICSHVMVGNNTNNFGMSGGSGSSSYLIQLSPTSHQQSTQQQKSSLSPAQQLQDEQEIAAILRNKELELQKQIHMQESAQVRIPTVNDDPAHVMSLCRACNSISCELIASLNIAHYIVTWAEREVRAVTSASHVSAERERATFAMKFLPIDGRARRLLSYVYRPLIVCIEIGAHRQQFAGSSTRHERSFVSVSGLGMINVLN